MTQIVDALAQFAIPIESVNPDEHNTVIHDERNIQIVMDSLTTFGQHRPLVVQSEGMIVRVGNGMLEAAKRLGWTEIAAIVVDETEAKAKARAIADNRSSDLHIWDDELLREVLASIEPEYTPDSLGWSEDELGAICDVDIETAPAPDDTQPDSGAPDKSTGRSLNATEGQWRIITQAVDALRHDQSDHAMNIGRCLELICADYLSSVGTQQTA